MANWGGGGAAAEWGSIARRMAHAGAVDAPRATAAERGPLARAVRARAAEIVARLDLSSMFGARELEEGTASLLSEELGGAAHLATAVIARWLETGLQATDEEMAELSSPAEHAAAGRIGLAEVTALYLSWRDLLLQVVAEEALRLETTEDLRREIRDVVRASCDSSLVRLTHNFDRRRAALEAQLAAEQSKLEHRASHDDLTGLWNRASLEQYLEEDLRRSGGSEVGVLFVDVDHFKTVNDRFGHACGDRFLVEVARRLVAQVRPVDVVARLGGDEFVVVCAQGGESDARAVTRSVAERIAAGMAAPFILGRDETVQATVSIGIALGRQDSAATLVAHADRAMYEAKRAGRARCVVYRSQAAGS